MTKTHYSAVELIGLPGMPGSKKGVLLRAAKADWPRRPRSGRGGGWEYPITCLPEVTRRALLDAMFASPARPTDYLRPTAELLSAGAAIAPEATPSAGAQTTQIAPPRGVVVAASTQANQRGRHLPVARESSGGTATLKTWQRECMDARLAIVQQTEQIALAIGKTKAIAYMVGKAATGELPVELQRLVRVANSRSGKSGSRTISARTLYRWIDDVREGGNKGLAPKAVADSSVPLWGPLLMDAYGKPSKPALAHAVAEVCSKGHSISYDQARRFLKKVGALTRENGRRGEHELRKIAPFVRRDWSALAFGDVYQMDGHQFDAEVAHPITGKPCRPEITTVIDCRTRAIVGFSVGFAESSWVVMDALRDACSRATIPAMLYTDRGSGYMNERVIGSVTGLCSRLGITHTTAIPYNSQARGIIERAHQTIWVTMAKDYATYMGADMDPQIRNHVHKITRNELLRARKLPTWTQFLADCEQRAADYNAATHKTLRCSPDEAVAQQMAAGAQLVKLDPEEAIDLFRPVEVRQVARGEIELFTNRYFARELAEYHGEKVLVAYEVRDPSHVYVRTLEGALICEAIWDGNKRAGFAHSVVDQAREKRAKGQIKRLERKIDDVREEATGTTAIEHAKPAMEVPPMAVEAPFNVEQDIAENLLVGDFTARRPMFGTDGQRYEWLMAHRNQWVTEDLVWLSDYVNSDIYSQLLPLYEMKGIAWTNELGFRAAAE